MSKLMERVIVIALSIIPLFGFAVSFVLLISVAILKIFRITRDKINKNKGLVK